MIGRARYLKREWMNIAFAIYFSNCLAYSHLCVFYTKDTLPWVDKRGLFANPLYPSSCSRSCWMAPLLKGSFNNYVDRILPFFDPPPPSCVDSFYTLSVDKNGHFLTPSPPHLVHVVIEWPLMCKNILIKCYIWRFLFIVTSLRFDEKNWRNLYYY